MSEVNQSLPVWLRLRLLSKGDQAQSQAGNYTIVPQLGATTEQAPFLASTNCASSTAGI